jgi:hypothetical protein
VAGRAAVKREAQRRTFQQDRVRLPPGTPPLNARGPRLNKAMETFAGKLGLALHFQATKRAVPIAGILSARWYPNHQVYTGAVPPTLFELVGEPSTLAQGSWNVGEQFLYASAASQDGRRSAHVAQFRESFAVAAIVFDDQADAPTTDRFSIFRPGFLQAAP